MAGAALFIGDGAIAHRDAIRRALGDDGRVAEPAAPPLAGTIAVLASAAREGDHRPHAIRPLYVRRTDAELAQAARSLLKQDAPSLLKKDA